MKKIYVLSLALSTALAGFSQFTNAKGELVKRKEFKESKVKPSNSNHTPKGLTLWSNEFDNSADWVLDNSCAYTGYNLVGGYDYVAGASTTAFLLVLEMELLLMILILLNQLNGYLKLTQV